MVFSSPITVKEDFVLMQLNTGRKKKKETRKWIFEELLDKHTAGKGSSDQYDMIVFSHLRWDFVYQRPQHIISRLSKKRRVLFVEEPVPFAAHEEGTALLRPVTDTLSILQPRVSRIADIGGLLKKYVTTGPVALGWFYSPAFLSVMDSFSFDKVVYDCMDELSLFRGATPEMVSQEKDFLKEADIVFTGGKSLYESKKQMHRNVFCFPSSVDRDHFMTALNGIRVPADISSLKKPVVGYYGVIDERIDMNLLHDVAQQNPAVSFVMIGPFAKIADHELARNHNIHYLGRKSYSELPGYLKAFDISMMPFAMNDSTRFISPTKTLEYMAAGKPVISTPVCDVVRDYKNCISIVSTADEFSQAIAGILHDDNSEKRGRDYDVVLQSTSWDSVAGIMEGIIADRRVD